MTAANWITLVLPVVGFLFGIILYVLQKRLDRQNEEQRERRELYRSSSIVLQKVHNTLKNGGTPEQAVGLIEALEETVAEIQVAAPDAVAQSWNELPGKALRILELRRKDEVESDDLFVAEQNFLVQKVDAISNMRNDTFGETTLTKARISEVADEMIKMSKQLDELAKLGRFFF